KGGKLTIPYDPYPSRPERFLKIAIFGESSAAGFHSERSFGEIVKRELALTPGDRPVYVKNYARPGLVFHRDEAEMVKRLIDRYDVFLIYAGNSEAWNPIYERGRLDVYGLTQPDARPTFASDIEATQAHAQRRPGTLIQAFVFRHSVLYS